MGGWVISTVHTKLRAEGLEEYDEIARSWGGRAFVAFLTAGTALTSILLSRKRKNILTAFFAVISFGLAVVFVHSGAINDILSLFCLIADISDSLYDFCLNLLRPSVYTAGYWFSNIDILTLVLVGAANILPPLPSIIWSISKRKKPRHETPAEVSISSPKRKKVQTKASAKSSVSPQEAYCELFQHALLLLLTFGIWQFIWVYRMTIYLNSVDGEEYRKPAAKLLLCIFVPFYYVYWIYKSAQSVDKLAMPNGMWSISTLCLICGLFIPIISAIIIHDRVNSIIAGKTVAKNVPYSFNANIEAIETLAKLHQEGILSDEEFQQKKSIFLEKILCVLFTASLYWEAVIFAVHLPR